MKLVLSSIEAAKKRKLAAKSGQIATVLVETVVGGVASGYSDGYVKVIFDAKETCLNRFVDVVLGEAVLIGREWGLRATQKTEARETPN
jgi:hypothetical protein